MLRANCTLPEYPLTQWAAHAAQTEHIAGARKLGGQSAYEPFVYTYITCRELHYSSRDRRGGS